MKKIGIDARLYFQTGVGTYLRNLLHYLQLLNPSDTTFYVYVMKEDSLKIQFSSAQFIKREVTSKWHTFAEQTDFLRVLNNDNLDLMHFTYFSYPVFYTRPFIATVHDVTPLLFKTGKASTKNPLLFEIKHAIFSFILKTQVNKAITIITPTETVKNQLVDLYGITIESKTHALYEGFNYELSQIKENDALASQINYEYFLYVGNFYPHKNVEAFIKAFAKVKTDIKLILLGPENYFSKRITLLVQKLKIEDRVVFKLSVPNEDLIFYYKNARGLINPSLSEGFGLPLIDAINYNIPIIASDIPVFKELLGDKYTSFKPTDVADIQKSIESFLSTKTVVNYGDLKEKYSFERMTKETLDLYNVILR